MRASLDETGKLTIKAESAVESFALSHWLNLWRDRQATLEVSIIERVTKDGPLTGGVMGTVEPINPQN